MTCVAGSRGTEFIKVSDPIKQRNSIYLLSGELDTYKLAASELEDPILIAGNKLVISLKDDAEYLCTYDSAEEEALINQETLAGGDIVSD